MKYDPTPDVNCKYGAPTGRHTGPEPSGNGSKWQLNNIRLDVGGYDRGGAYWGLGKLLYWCCNEAGEEAFFRLDMFDYLEAHDAWTGSSSTWRRHDSRIAAKHVVRRDYDPEARFYK